MNSLAYCSLILVILLISEIESKVYTTSNNRTYYIDDAYEYTWYDAHIECSSRDMALLTIDSKEKYDDIYQLLLSGKFNDKPPHLWIGAIGINKKFAWILTGRPIIPSLWCDVCPNNHPQDENCVEFWGRAHGLNDLICSAKCGFVCEDRVITPKPTDCQSSKSNVLLNIIKNN